jgi:hypothetical protein
MYQPPSQEPYPNFFVTLNQLMEGQIEYTRLRILIIKIGFALAIIYLVLNVLACILAILLPIFGASILAWLVSQIGPLFSSSGGV